jgi:putative endonuclease
MKLKYITDSKENAVYLEGFIKRMKSRIFIEKVINDPTILEQILSKRK